MSKKFNPPSCFCDRCHQTIKPIVKGYNRFFCPLCIRNITKQMNSKKDKIKEVKHRE